MGDDLYEALNKALLKIPTSSVVDLQEMHSSLKIVPKAIMAFLIKELTPLEDKTNKEIKLPWKDNTFMLINKEGPDIYGGHIREGGKILHEFDLTAIPQLGAHIMSTLELYDADFKDDEKAEEKPEAAEGVDMQQKVNQLEQKINETQIKLLENKVNDLMRVVAQNKATAPVKSTSKTEGLTKAGTMPTMPKPPRAGSMGGVTGTKAGILGTKTAATDKMAKPPRGMNNPDLKVKPLTTKPQAAPKATASTKPMGKSEDSKKTLFFEKTEDSKCADCGQPDVKNGKLVRCACFKALSEPSVKKTENGMIVKFGEDWDKESVETLYKSLMGSKNGRK